MTTKLITKELKDEILGKNVYEYTKLRRENQQLKGVVGVLSFELSKLKKDKILVCLDTNPAYGHRRLWQALYSIRVSLTPGKLEQD